MIEITRENHNQQETSANEVIISTPIDSEDIINNFTLERCWQVNVKVYDWESLFNFDTKKFYKFNNLEEFCIWYLQQHKYLIEHNDGENIGYIPKIIPDNIENGTNTCPSSCPKCLSMQNTNKKKKIKRKDKYKDILKILEIRDRIGSEVELAHLYSPAPFKHDNRMIEYANELNAFLEQEVEE